MRGLEEMLEGVNDMGKQFNSTISDLGKQAKTSMNKRQKSRETLFDDMK